MRSLAICLLAAMAFMAASVEPVSGQAKPEFQLGFKMLALQIPDVVGDPIENERWGANGDSLQRTTKGLMAWRKADNWTAFTNGARTWINGPNGIVERSNSERFPWEADQGEGPPVPMPMDPDDRPKLVPFKQPMVVSTMGKEVEITVLEVVRNADDRLRALSPSTYDQLGSGPYDEKVLIRLRIRYVDGPAGEQYASDRLREYSFLQLNGASGNVFLGTLPDPPVDKGLLSVGESKEGWIVAVVGKGSSFVMHFGRSVELRIPFALE